MINFSIISNIFSDYLKSYSKIGYSKKIYNLIFLCIKTNKIIWSLEDEVRAPKLEYKNIAQIKKKIDKNNHIRNNLMREMDLLITRALNIKSEPLVQFYSETPGMLIDRLSILFIKLLSIQRLLEVIKEDELKKEYGKKEKIVLRQIETLGNFFDKYIIRLKKKEIVFEVQEPVKIYNDKRIRKYIQNTKDCCNSTNKSST